MQASAPDARPEVLLTAGFAWFQLLMTGSYLGAAGALYVRYCVQDTLSRVVPRAVDLIGDLDSMASEEVGHLAAYANGPALHPPARDRMTGPLAAYLVDGPLTIA
ncbi:hypothetical protein ACFV0L_35610 [Streptosporangium canum]|uniref:hypothetical protein n=1 Tax=Streptosporangium canum TaxID=324952 RepID=UPI0036C71FC8